MEYMSWAINSIESCLRTVSEDQLEVIHDLLLKSPPGELYVILDGNYWWSIDYDVELKDLLGGIELPPGPINEFLKEYNLCNNVLVDVPNQKRPLLLVGSLDDETNVYQDVLKGKSYRFDHLNNTVTEEVSFEETPVYSSQVLQLKKALINECRKYVEHRFSSRSSALYSLFSRYLTNSVGCDGDHLDILIVGELIKLTSYYSGRWVSQYSVDMTDSAIHVVGNMDTKI